MNQHVELGNRSVTFRHIVVGERSVTCRHKRNKDNESWNYVNKFEWKEPNSQMSMIWRLESSWMYLTLFIKDSCTWCCYRLSMVVGLWYYLIYTVFYFELADDIYSVPVLCTDPYFYVFFFLFVECSKRAVIFDSTVTQDSLTTSEIQGELMLLVWTGSSSSSLDALRFRHGLAFTCLAFRILLV